MDTNSWYVLTGGPGAGKTTLLNVLGARGYRTVPEIARAYIKKELAQGKSLREIRADEIAFQREVLRLKMAMEQALPREECIFFDRGLHDSVAYFDIHKGSLEAELVAALHKATYAKIFLLDLVSYASDGVRTETWEEAQRIHERLGTVYTEAGMPVVCVPVLPPEERVTYILNCLYPKVSL